MNTKLVRVDVESLQDEAKKSQSLQILKEAGEIKKMEDWWLFQQRLYTG